MRLTKEQENALKGLATAFPEGALVVTASGQSFTIVPDQNPSRTHQLLLVGSLSTVAEYLKQQAEKEDEKKGPGIIVPRGIPPGFGGVAK